MLIVSFCEAIRFKNCLMPKTECVLVKYKCKIELCYPLAPVSRAFSRNNKLIKLCA